MSFANLRQLNIRPRRAWALIGEAGSGKSTFTTQLRGPLLIIDADARYQEVRHHHSGDVYSLSDQPADYHDPLRIAEILDEKMPGEEIGTIDTSRPNNAIDTYIAIQERRIAAGTGSRYSSVARNYNGTYSAQRQELVEGAAHYRRLFAYLVAQFYLPVWRRFVDAARLSGRLQLQRATDLDSLYRPEIRAPALPWIDPKKEIEAHVLAVTAGFRSRQQVIRDLGGDPRTVDRQLAADEFDVRPGDGGSVPVSGTELDDIEEDAA